MAIESSTIRLYSDEQKTTILKEVETTGPFTSIDISGLAAGTVYYATVFATDTNHATSEESDTMVLYTLPYVEFYGTPAAGDRYATIDLYTETEDVEIVTYGIEFSLNSEFTNSFSVEGTMPRIDCWDLDPNTTYYIRPYVIDEFNRKYTNREGVDTITTPHAAPIAEWVGSCTAGIDNITGTVNVISTIPISSVTVRYFTHGGGAYNNVSLAARSGEQSFVIPNLDPNTSYDVRIQAVNATATGASDTLVISTLPAEISMNVIVAYTQVNSSDNSITASSIATANTSAVTVTDHSLLLFEENDPRSTRETDNYNGGNSSQIMGTLRNAQPNSTYWVFSKIKYTVQGDPTEYEMYSEGVKVETYAFLDISTVRTTVSSAQIPYSVVGSADSVQLEYSKDQVNWIPLPATSLNGGTVTVEDLEFDTLYYVRGRAQSEAGWQEYKETTFRTEGVVEVSSVIVDTITNITPESAIVNLAIS